MNKLESLEKQMVREKEGQKRLNEILEIVCQVTGATPEQLRSKETNREVSDARRLFWHVTGLIKDYDFTLATLGAFFNRDHSTVIAARSKTEELLAYNASFKKKFRLIAAHFAITILPMTAPEKQAALALVDKNIEHLKKWLADHHDNPYRQKILSDLREAEAERKKIEQAQQKTA
jgi:DnaA-like protein